MNLADDRVWFDAAHKVRQICHEVQVCCEAGQRVLVLAHFAATLAAVEASLREAAIPYERFSAFNFDELCAGPPAMLKVDPPSALTKDGETAAGDIDTTSPVLPGRGRVWVGLARSFQTANAPAAEVAIASPIRIIVAEHHPRQTRDLEIAQGAVKLSCESVIGFHISLDDPLLQYFGGASLRPFLEKLGLGADECISHPLVTNAIRHAQEKIEKTVERELPVESIADWFKYNLPGRTG
jgi:preprotein translocase subunit SecA